MIANALAEYAVKSARNWNHDRKLTVGASSIARCLRQTWFDKKSIAPDPGHKDNYGYRVRGSVYEDSYWAPALKAHYGKRLRYAGDNQKTFFDPDSPLSATPDGLLRDLTHHNREEWGLPADTNCVLLEAKSVGSFQPTQFPKSEHVFQTQVQMGLVRLAGRYKPDAAIICYVSCFDWSRIKECTVLFDAAVFERARSRARLIMAAQKAHQIEPEGIAANECRYCAWTNACEAAGAYRPNASPHGTPELTPHGVRAAA
jgi:hypothetical protein